MACSPEPAVAAERESRERVEQEFHRQAAERQAANRAAEQAAGERDELRAQLEEIARSAGPIRGAQAAPRPA